MSSSRPWINIAILASYKTFHKTADRDYEYTDLTKNFHFNIMFVIVVLWYLKLVDFTEEEVWFDFCGNMDCVKSYTVIPV